MGLPETWTVIAQTEPAFEGVLGRNRWALVDGAPFGLAEARRMYEGGHILMAQRRLESGKMGLLIKAAGVSTSRSRW